MSRVVVEAVAVGPVDLVASKRERSPISQRLKREIYFA
jgi:hypothetical protein